MSKPDATVAQAIPSAFPRKTETSAGKRKTAPRPRTREVPWLWIVAGCGVCGALLIGVCAFGFALANFHGPAAASEPVAQVASKSALVEEPLAVQKANDGGAAVKEETTPPSAAQPKAPLPEVQAARAHESPPAAKFEPALAADKSPEVKPGNAQPRQARKKVDLTVFADCQKIGTDVLFMKYPHEAFTRARAEKKLVFMVHLSGNLEDPDFT